MRTFYDPIELDDIDINDSTAKFYIIKLPNEAGFKFCATTQNLDSPQMKYDPITRVKEYWPITREQLSKANLITLFPKDKIRTAPFKTAEELNKQCHFDPPFNPNVRPDHFGRRALEQPTSDPEASNESFPFQRLMDSYSRYINEYEHFFSNMGTPQRETRMSQRERELSDSLFSRERQQSTIPDWLIDRYSPGLSRQIRTDVYHSLARGEGGRYMRRDMLTQAERSSLNEIRRRDEQRTIELETEMLLLLQEARRTGCTEDQVEAIRTNVLDKPLILEAIIDYRSFSIADFRDLTIEQIFDIGTIALNDPRCVLDLTDGRVTIAQLAGLNTEALRHAVETRDYPQSGTQLR